MPATAFRLRAVPAAAAVLVLLSSCASLRPLQVDRAATAPQLQGYGHSDIAISTRSPRARQLFNDGVLQAYAFNEVEAVRTFKAALAQDPECAMCAWGVAWQLGPNINDGDRSKVPEALKYVDHALAHLEGATPRERALVESLALRYAHASQQRETAPLLAARCGKAPAEAEGESVDPLDQAYADRMRKLADAYPRDPDILSLYAEAEIIATPGEHPWSADGRPAGRMGDVADRLERLLPAYPEHTGINHYMIHAVDAVSVAERAVLAADRLGRLAPAAPHLLHMPAHTYVAVGRFAEAQRVNEQAVAADLAFARAEKAQGFSVSKDWRGHNEHFLWYAAMMNGQEQAALDAAAGLSALATWDSNAGEFLRGLRLLTLERFGRWDQLAAEPAPAGNKGAGKLYWQQARGIAFARLGRLQEADAALAAAQAQADALRAGLPASAKRTRAMADHAVQRLAAEIAAARGDMPQAIAHQRKAVEAAAVLDDFEPPMAADLARVQLGDLLARAKRWPEAEAAYREALALRPAHPLAQRGLAQALAAQGKA